MSNGERRTSSAQSVWSQPLPKQRQRMLGRAKIVAAAIALADEAGASALTMKAVAEKLGSYSPMALYRYVISKDGLIDLMLDAATSELTIPSRPSPDWRGDLRTLAMQTRQLCKQHRWYAQLVHTRPPTGPHMMRRTEFMLAVLVAQGMTTAQAMTYATLIDRHIFGSGLQEAEEVAMNQRYELEEPAEFMAQIAAVHELAAADGRLPHLTNWLASPTGPPPDERFELGLGFLLDGIAGQLS